MNNFLSSHPLQLLHVGHDDGGPVPGNLLPTHKSGKAHTNLHSLKLLSFGSYDYSTRTNPPAPVSIGPIGAKVPQ